MRMRRKPWARPELEKCPFFIDKPTENIGNWSKWFKKTQPMHLELGCGKGVFISQIASENAGINYIGIDIKSEVLANAKRNVEKEFLQKGIEVDNVALTSQNIERIDLILSDEDIIDRIYINFCNPWPKKKHKKRRLTYPTQLEKYKAFLKKDGEIYFKTDDDELFDESIEYFKGSGFDIVYKTYDLYNSDVEQNFTTEHEIMFTQKGINIKFLIAKRADI